MNKNESNNKHIKEMVKKLFKIIKTVQEIRERKFKMIQKED